MKYVLSDKSRIFGGEKKMQKSSWNARLKVWMCKGNFVYHRASSRSRHDVPLSMFSLSLVVVGWFFLSFCCCYLLLLLLVVVVIQSKVIQKKKKPIDLLTLHWVSAGPHSADARRATLSTEGRWWQFTCTCLLKDLMHLFFFVCLFCFSFYL